MPADWFNENSASRIYIRNEYLKILKKIIPGKIYGVEVKEEDVETLVVSAYYQGQLEEMKDKGFSPHL